MSGTPESDSVRHALGKPEMVGQRRRLADEVFTERETEEKMVSMERLLAQARHAGRIEGAVAACESFYANERTTRGRYTWRLLVEGEGHRIVDTKWPKDKP